MATTPNLGLHYYGGDVPGSITDNGSQHTAGDRLFLDQVIQQLAVSARHYVPAVATAPANFSLDSNPNSGQLQDGVTYFYRVALVGLDGFERVASDEASVSMPDVLAAPTAPGLRDAPGGSLQPGLYYYALTAKSDTQESTLGAGATVNVFAGTNQAIYVDAPSDAQGVPLQVWRKKDTDPGYTRLGTISAGQTLTDDGSTAANPYALDPAYAPPSNNRGRANSSVTITLVGDAATAADEGTISSWRIYRSTISGYYSAQSLVHDVVETDDEDGNGDGTLRTSWIDTGDALRVGQPQFKDRSLRLTPWAPETVTALPADTSVYPPNYLIVFDEQLYILRDGSWSAVGGGTKVTYGTTTPATTARTSGDLHLNTTTGVWLALVGGSWTPVYTPTGRLLSGTEAPTTQGLSGDFYLHLSEPAQLYGPKGTTWPDDPIPLGASGGGGAGGAGGTGTETASAVMTSPNGSRWRLAVDDDGTLITVPTLEPGPPPAPTDPTLQD